MMEKPPPRALEEAFTPGILAGSEPRNSRDRGAHRAGREPMASGLWKTFGRGHG